MEGIENQVRDLQQELQDIHPKLEQNAENTAKRQEKISHLMESKNDLSEKAKEKSDEVGKLKEEVDDLQKTVDDALSQKYEDLQDAKEKMTTIKMADFVSIKTMKNATAILKLSLISACFVSNQISIDPSAERTTKKLITDNG